MKSAWWVLLAFWIQSAAAQLVVSGPAPHFPRDGAVQYVQLDGPTGKNVKFKYSGVSGINSAQATPPNFIMVAPSSGTTPALIQIAVNQSVVPYLSGGNYILDFKFTTVDQDPPATAGVEVFFSLPHVLTPVITSIVNTASFQPLISPGATVSIFGSDLAAPKLSGTYDDTGSYPKTLGNASVTFNGVPASLQYVSPGQINALVPPAVAGQKSVDMVVKHFDQSSTPVSVPLLDTSPGIFTASQTGSGQAAILQLGADGAFTYNSVDNPAPRGVAFELFCTGAGVWTGNGQSFIGDISPYSALYFPSHPVSLTIGGQPAKILYAGTVGYQEIWSLLQVNAVVPDGVGPGPQPLVLRIGQNDNSLQKVMMVIR